VSEDPAARFRPPWTIRAVATAANVSQAFVRKAISVGALAAHRRGRLVRIAPSEAERFVSCLGALEIEPHQEHGAHPLPRSTSERRGKTPGSPRNAAVAAPG